MTGIGILPIETVFAGQKVRTRVSGQAAGSPFEHAQIEGYEIHMGKSISTREVQPFCIFPDGHTDGVSLENAWGTYLHGLFDTGELVTALADFLLTRKGLSTGNYEAVSHKAYQEEQLDILAKEVRSGLDMEAIYRAMDKFN